MPYHHLTRAERHSLHCLRIAGHSAAEIARVLERHPSTIYREWRRNASGPRCYGWSKAHTMYRRRRCGIRRRARRDHARLMGYVCEHLKGFWSQEQISGRLRRDFPKDTAMRISHMTVYRYVANDRQAGGSLWRCLRQARKRKRKRYGSLDQRGHLQGRVMIDQRPSIVERRARIGDWEGDTMWGSTHRAYLATFVERRSGYLLAQAMPDRSASALTCAARRAFASIPRALRHTLTVDNGKEFARFRELEQTVGTIVYFAHPYASFERGTNENTNGLIRQYLPKKTDLANYTARRIRRAVRDLNHRPRKRLGYRTPHEVFQQAVLALDM